ncbi:hypothetical protein Clacol_001162 [Clathrus columnatus]|uniref:Uncharacterized protein n=1 Tax=Clathrus columnatus TaxID=1419009 RepID=A0AAV5A1T0_9AGAM|nr:hypothetical protein Clacol_001162 [Clathrus columnatus]
MSDEILIGDYVSFQHGIFGTREGVVVGSRTEYPSGRQFIEVEVDPGVVQSAWFPTVRRIRRVQYGSLPAVKRTTTVERRVYW